MGGWRGFVGIALAPGAYPEATWSPSKGENRGAGPVQKKRYLCNRDGGLLGVLSLGELLRASRSG